MSQQDSTTTAQPYDFDVEAVKRLVCPRCEAKPTERCRTVSGRVTETHTSRWEPLAEAFAAGEQGR